MSGANKRKRDKKNGKKYFIIILLLLFVIIFELFFIKGNFSGVVDKVKDIKNVILNEEKSCKYLMNQVIVDLLL